jgi:glycosyltransferase involved in cell wall biosynthesis
MKPPDPGGTRRIEVLRQRMRFALISNLLPPSESGPAITIHRLLRDLDPASYCLISSRDYGPTDQTSPSTRLPGTYFHVRPLVRMTRGDHFRRLQALTTAATFGLAVILRARQIASILRREGCDAVIVCTGGHEILDFPSGYLASRLVGTRFYAYLLDQYSNMASYLLRKSFLRRLEAPIVRAWTAIVEAPIMKGASAIITPNEFQRDEVRRLYQREAVLIRNACDLSAYESPGGTRGTRSDAKRGELAIVYTGAVSDLHYQGFRNLIAAIHLLARQDIRLHLYTAQSPLHCESVGITGPVAFHPHEDFSAMPAVQQQAEGLCLRLGFETSHSEVVRTAAPGKMGEYLASGRPILVHAPADSFIAWYFRRHECGLVVDDSDPSQLAKGLGLLLSDSGLRERLGARARERAQADFSLPRARAEFAAAIGLEAPATTGTQTRTASHWSRDE